MTKFKLKRQFCGEPWPTSTLRMPGTPESCSLPKNHDGMHYGESATSSGRWEIEPDGTVNLTDFDFKQGGIK